MNLHEVNTHVSSAYFKSIAILQYPFVFPSSYYDPKGPHYTDI